MRRARAALPIVFLGGLLLYSVWPWLPVASREHPPRTFVVYGFSILGDAMTKGVLPKFRDEWLARTGERVEFLTSFAGSGTITNQLIMGVPADVALLALELDAIRLAKANLTPPFSWRQLPHGGTLNGSPFVIVVRPGNPKGIRDFADLAQPGMRIVHPDPLTSGGANWAILAEYGAAMREHPNDPEAGHRLLLGIWRNVVAQAASARAARTQFENGFGDALVTYEQDALLDRARGKLDADIVYPRRTIVSEHTFVVIEHNVRPRERELERALVQYLWSEPAQRLFVEYGFRSFDPSLNAANPLFGKIEDAFRIADFGGWEQAKRDIVDGVWKNQVLKELRR